MSGQHVPWDPPKYAYHAFLLLLTLPLTTPQSLNPFRWHFYLQETWSQQGATITRLLSQVDCQPQGCQARISMPFSNFNSLSRGWSDPTICFIYDQVHPTCRTTWVQTSGGCPYHWRVTHHTVTEWENSKQDYYRNRWRLTDNRRSYYLNIPDPWDNRWARGGRSKTIPICY